MPNFSGVNYTTDDFRGVIYTLEMTMTIKCNTSAVSMTLLTLVSAVYMTPLK